jgi:hypothetical protein
MEESKLEKMKGELEHFLVLFFYLIGYKKVGLTKREGRLRKSINNLNLLK